MSIREKANLNLIHQHELEDILDLLKENSMDSVLINKKDPITYRLFHTWETGKRVCLHKMLRGSVPPHPHKYNVRVLILSGRYKHEICYPIISPNQTYIDRVYSETCISGSQYHIDRSNTHHSLEILNPTYSIMFNDYNFNESHPSCKTVEGKGFKEIPEGEKYVLEREFQELIEEYIERM